MRGALSTRPRGERRLKEKTKAGKRRMLQVALSTEESSAFGQAAHESGVNRKATWMRAVCRAAAGMQNGETPPAMPKPVRRGFPVGLDTQERAAFERAAQEVGITRVSCWMRVVCRAAAGMR